MKEEASIMRSPLGPGIKKSLAESLGWIDSEVKVGDILQAVSSKCLNFAMTCATQSNSSFSSYIRHADCVGRQPGRFDKR